MPQYHRELQPNERVIQISLGNDKYAFLLFTYVNEQNKWVCVMEDETMADLKAKLCTQSAHVGAINAMKVIWQARTVDLRSHTRLPA